MANEKKWNKFLILAESVLTEIVPGSEEEFITEHYWGYTCINKSCTSEYAVEHPRWKIYRVKESKIEVEFGKLYGEEFAFLNSKPPDSVMLAEGSEIIVRSMTRIM